MQKTLASQPLASGWTAVQGFHGIKPCTSSFSRLIRSTYKRGVLTLGCSLSPESISWETSSKVTSSVKLPFTSFLRILRHSSLPSILRGLDHGMTPRLFLRPFQLLKYWNTAMAPLFHQPKAPPTWSRTKGLLPGAGEGVLQKPLPPWSGIRPACRHTTLWSVVPSPDDPARFSTLCFIRLCFFQSLVQYTVDVQ